ncbi:MAG: hypothetical protein LUD15_11805 [Bacteroides sp.]|nr:hypothetical protein [Bacteroides sp.]
MQEKRLDGFAAISDLYESLRGKGKVDKYEIKNPKVQLYGETAILTYNLESWA